VNERRASTVPHAATKIVATLGPASSSDRIVRDLLRAGVDVFRLNMSHGNHEAHARNIARVRRLSRRFGRPVGVLVDLQGPKVRTALNDGGELLTLRKGEVLELRSAPGRSRAGKIVVDFPRLAGDVEIGDRVLLDDGKLVLRIVGRRPRVLHARVLRGGPLKERAGVNVPGRALSVAIPTRKDRNDILFALRHGADFIALSFVQSAGDVRRLRRMMEAHRRKHGVFPGRGPIEQRLPAVIAKLEKPAALDDLDAVLSEADGVMVARGDLGVELSLEQVPIWQKDILRRARARGLFTITATQMLESMIESASPTRAEVSDVANAIFDGTDAVMLSAETASGAHPVEAVRVLTRIALEVESHGTLFGHLAASWNDDLGHDHAPVEAVVHAAVDLAERAHARWIVVFTLRGQTARLIARYRPRMGIVALTPHARTRRRLSLAWNTRTLHFPVIRNSHQMLVSGLRLLRRSGLVKEGDRLVIVAGDATLPDASNLLRLVHVKRR